MARVRKLVSHGGRDCVRFRCPGCDYPHTLPVEPGQGPVWGFNGDVERPTLTPSILAQMGHYASGQEGQDCWCTFAQRFPDQACDDDPKCGICHFFVTDGRIQFLSDCTHALAGKTIDLPEITD